LPFGARGGSATRQAAAAFDSGMLFQNAKTSPIS
jgi:hypothetical protein